MCYPHGLSMKFPLNIFTRKLSPEELIDDSAKIFENAFIEAGKKTLEGTRDGLSHLLKAVLPGISSLLAANFVLEAVGQILGSLIAKDHIAEVQKSLSTLLASPMRTGIDQLRIALQISTTTPKTDAEREYISDRFRDALRNFDQALVLSSDLEKGPIHLYRAMASIRIPGGEQEAAIHLKRFSESCISRAESLERNADLEESTAARSVQEAASIQVVRSRAGGGLVGMDESAPLLKKRVLERSARKHNQKALDFRHKAQRLRNSAAAAEFICTQNLVPPEAGT
jgi:hypothetical protein